MTHAVEDDLSHPEATADQTPQIVPEAAATDNGLYEHHLTDNEQYQSDNPGPSESEKHEEKVVTVIKKVKHLICCCALYQHFILIGLNKI